MPLIFTSSLDFFQPSRRQAQWWWDQQPSLPVKMSLSSSEHSSLSPWHPAHSSANAQCGSLPVTEDTVSVRPERCRKEPRSSRPRGKGRRGWLFLTAEGLLSLHKPCSHLLRTCLSTCTVRVSRWLPRFLRALTVSASVYRIFLSWGGRAFREINLEERKCSQETVS